MNNLGLRLRIFLVIMIAIITIGTYRFMAAEGLSIEDAFYFCIVTVTMVGYGDISPVTSAGKVLSILLIITGVGTFPGVVANATEILLNKQEQKARMGNFTLHPWLPWIKVMPMEHVKGNRNQTISGRCGMSYYNENYWDKRYEWRQEEYQQKERQQEDNGYWDRRYDEEYRNRRAERTMEQDRDLITTMSVPVE